MFNAIRDFLLSIGYDKWILPTLLFLPAIGAILTWLHGIYEYRTRHFGRQFEAFARWLPFVIFELEFLLSLGMWFTYEPNGAAFQFTSTWAWIPEWGVSMSLGIDGISLFLVLLVTFLLPIAAFASWTNIDRAVHSYHALFLVLTTGMLGVFMARDFVMFYFFWELVLIPMFIIIGVWGGERRVYAGLKFFLYTFIGSLFMLVAILYIGFKTGDAMLAAGAQSVDRPSFLFENALQYFRPTARESFWLFLGFFAAFAVKIPMWPFHTWLPDAHVQAPTEGSVDLAAILLKMGSYGFMRIILPLFPGVVLNSTVRNIVLALGIISIIVGALVALVQTDFKRLVAYSSVSHMGFVTLGIFALTTESLQGAMMVQLAHGLSSAGLFLMVGMLYDRRHTRDLSQFGGIARVMPLYGACLMAATLSSIAVPGTFGFVGEFLVLLGSFARYPVLALVASLGVILSACYMLWCVQRVLFNPLNNARNRGLPDLNFREAIMLIPLCGFIVVMGVFPAPFLRRMEPTLARLVHQVESRAAEQALGTAPVKVQAVARTSGATDGGR
ncbi:proton-translocating NADH-quinone oxidoreductase, chain M [Gemmatirosa kalamazoonensis]|uniref:Proton-translocating NADH-quinone oxidoreductase, chain M n=1 Tax=Gemmatirosa kalamazoonensis TaxID=861299 RepID=W0RKH4_9BACT|nr:NADH-quinone oxidoreductase subunit M [Gemmatirosa kalamazoonensis]AHG90820.1 proton-translocating NADH-quinone oxidoreductase, chain M [Gemmatirosa kalamazoonensis]